MNKLIKTTAIITISILLQACAPDAKQGANDGGTWWRVTPVDIAEMDGNASSNNESLIASPSTSQMAINTSSVTVAGGNYKVFTTEHSTRTAIYKCAIGTDRFTSTDANCEGQQIIGFLGYIERASSGAAPTALYRCAGRGIHQDAVNPADCLNNGLAIEGVLGYVP